jgi:hypothetical protein
MSNSFGGDVIDMLDMDDLTQFMETMSIATNHKLRLKATFASWKKNPDAAFEALASAKVARATHVRKLQLVIRLQAAAAAKKVQDDAAAAKKVQDDAAAAKKKQDDAKDNIFCVEHKGFVYRALAEGWDPHQSQKSGVKDQSETLLALPSGYHIAPNEANCIEVVASYGWDTHCMVLADGSSVCTKSYSVAGQIESKDLLVTEGDKYRPGGGSRGILIRKHIL